MSKLLAFIDSLPIGPAYAPIYAKGETFGKREDVSQGKAPHENSHYRKFSPADVRLLVEQNPKRYAAVGVFTGIRSDGIVVLDVDKNLSVLQRKWGDTLDGAPKIVSTKKNAAKYLFRVPEDQRNKVKGITGSHTGKGYEVLWGMQAIIGGAYPGSSDGSAPAGTYRLAEGDLAAIPSAPEWLLAEMRARKDQDAPAPTRGLVKNRRGLDFSGRTQDEIAEIVHDCLQVLPHLGRGSEDYWWQVGAMVAETLPNDLGLTLWAAWSSNDPAYEEEWSAGNPCEAKWPHLVSKAGRPGNMGLGSLILEADRFDPERQRFQDASRRTLEEVEETQVTRVQRVALDFAEVVRRAREVIELDNPAEVNYRLHALAVEAGYRDKEALERLLIDQLQYENQSDTMSLVELLDTDYKREYIIPDLLPKPAVVLIYGAGGDGKSMSAWTIAKHVATGKPFVIRGKEVPVEQGHVLLLNGDQPLVQLQEQLEEVELPRSAPVTIRTDWSLQRYAQFVRLIEKLQPKLVVIDSLIGCSGGKAFDENKSDFATPLYWLTRNNGVLFPATTILIIHHSNKQGGFRGTSAIRDAVDEVWALKMPDDKESELTGRDARIITIEKSRSGRRGTQLLMKQQADLCFTVSDWTPEIDEERASSAASVTDRVLQRLRLSFPGERTRRDLCGDPVVGGSVDAVRKSLQRLLKRGLIEIASRSKRSQGGSAEVSYRAVLFSPRVYSVESCPSGADPLQRKGFAVGQTVGQSGSVPLFQGGGVDDSVTGTDSLRRAAETTGTPSADDEGCPTANPLQRKGSAYVGQVERGIRAGVKQRKPASPASPLDPEVSSGGGRNAEQADAARRALDAASEAWD